MMTTQDFPAVPRRDRIHILRDFLLQTFKLEDLRKGYILDVAGGKGDLSFVLVNKDQLRAVVVDPRFTDHYKILRTVQWYHDNPEEAFAQATEGQALAGLQLKPPFQMPLHLRMFVDSSLLSALTKDNEEEWNNYWNQSRQRLDRLSFMRQRQKKSTSPKDQHEETGILDPDQAWKIFHSTSLILGWHPDEATDYCIDLAIRYCIPFVVCPCCVIPLEFPSPPRKTRDGTRVRGYDDYIKYLREKHPKMRQRRLPFNSSATGHGAGLARNIILYMLPTDYES